MKKKLFFLLALSISPSVFCDDVSGPAGTFINQFLDEGITLTRRSKVNWTGAGVTCVDNSVLKRLDCTVTTTGGGSSASSFSVNYNDVLVSSPTRTLNFLAPLTAVLQGGTSVQIGLAAISFSTGTVGKVDISTQTNLTVSSPLILTNDALSISAISLSTGVVGPLSISSGTITKVFTTTITFNDGTIQNTAAVTSAGDITAVNSGSGLSGGGLSGSVTLSLDPNATHYIHNQDSLQADTTAHPQFLRVGTSGAIINGPLNLDGVITASNTVITTTAGLLDATKLSGFVPNGSLDGSSVTKKGNTFNTANKLLLLDGSGLVPDANLSANVSLLGSSIDISAETNLSVQGPLSLVGDKIVLDSSTFTGGGGSSIYKATATAYFPFGLITNSITSDIAVSSTSRVVIDEVHEIRGSTMAHTGYFPINGQQPKVQFSLGQTIIYAQGDPANDGTVAQFAFDPTNSKPAIVTGGEVEFISTNSWYVNVMAPDNMPAPYDWRLPLADAAGCVKSDGSGNLSVSACGGGGLQLQDATTYIHATTFTAVIPGVVGGLVVSSTRTQVPGATSTIERQQWEMWASSVCVGPEAQFSASGAYQDFCSVSLDPGLYKLDVLGFGENGGGTNNQMVLAISKDSGNSCSDCTSAYNLVEGAGPVLGLHQETLNLNLSTGIATTTRFYLKGYMNYTGAAPYFRSSITVYRR